MKVHSLNHNNQTARSGKWSAWIALLLLLTFTDCSEVIDLNTEDLGGQLVIYGRITNGTLGNVVEVSRTTANGQAPQPVSGAVVRVIGEGGVQGAYTESTTDLGTYELNPGSIQGVIGQAYHIEVSLPNGASYASRPEVMPAISARDSLYFNIEIIEAEGANGTAIERDVIRIFADTEIFDPRPDLYLKWSVEEVYSFKQAVLPRHNFPFYSALTCYMTNDLEDQRILLYDGFELNATGIFGQSVVDRVIDENFRGTHYFNFIQQTLTQEAFEFWKSVDQNANRVGSIFDLPPGKIGNNLYNVNDPDERILGYFEVTSIDSARLKVTNREINRFYNEPCPLNPEVNFLPLMCYRCLQRYYDPECLDCRVLHNSSYDRPPYFN